MRLPGKRGTLAGSALADTAIADTAIADAADAPSAPKRKIGQTRTKEERANVKLGIPHTPQVPDNPLLQFNFTVTDGKSFDKFTYTLSPEQKRLFTTDPDAFEALERDWNQLMTYNEDGTQRGYIHGARTSRAVQANECLGKMRGDPFASQTEFDEEMVKDPRRSGNYAIELWDGSVIDCSLNPTGVAWCNDATLEDTRLRGILPMATLVEVRDPDDPTHIDVFAVAVCPMEKHTPVYVSYGSMSLSSVPRDKLYCYYLHLTFVENDMMGKQYKAVELTEAGNMFATSVLLYPTEFATRHTGHGLSKAFKPIEEPILSWLIPRPVSDFGLTDKQAAAIYWERRYTAINRRWRRQKANSPIILVPGSRPKRYTPNPNYVPPVGARKYPHYD